MFNKTTVIRFIILFIAIIFICEPSFAATRSDVLTGVTTARRMVINQNIQQTKQKAVSDALKIALQNAFATLVSRQV
ncbi:MAG: hypothetical protein KAH62_03470, partial [Desulfobacula sp.]|nr:hypothetical protein [Desulfobacula sp.]